MDQSTTYWSTSPHAFLFGKSLSLFEKDPNVVRAYANRDSRDALISLSEFAKIYFPRLQIRASGFYMRVFVQGRYYGNTHIWVSPNISPKAAAIQVPALAGTKFDMLTDVNGLPMINVTHLSNWSATMAPGSYSSSASSSSYSSAVGSPCGCSSKISTAAAASLAPIRVPSEMAAAGAVMATADNRIAVPDMRETATLMHQQKPTCVGAPCDEPAGRLAPIPAGVNIGEWLSSMSTACCNDSNACVGNRVPECPKMVPIDTCVSVGAPAAPELVPIGTRAENLAAAACVGAEESSGSCDSSCPKLIPLDSIGKDYVCFDNCGSSSASACAAEMPKLVAIGSPAETTPLLVPAGTRAEMVGATKSKSKKSKSKSKSKSSKKQQKKQKKQQKKQKIAAEKDPKKKAAMEKKRQEKKVAKRERKVEKRAAKAKEKTVSDKKQSAMMRTERKRASAVARLDRTKLQAARKTQERAAIERAEDVRAKAAARQMTIEQWNAAQRTKYAAKLAMREAELASIAPPQVVVVPPPLPAAVAASPTTVIVQPPAPEPIPAGGIVACSRGDDVVVAKDEVGPTFIKKGIADPAEYDLVSPAAHGKLAPFRPRLPAVADEYRFFLGMLDAYSVSHESILEQPCVAVALSDAAFIEQIVVPNVGKTSTRALIEMNPNVANMYVLYIKQHVGQLARADLVDPLAFKAALATGQHELTTGQKPREFKFYVGMSGASVSVAPASGVTSAQAGTLFIVPKYPKLLVVGLRKPLI